MQLKAVLFDLDGTLLDSAPGITAAINLLRKSHQLPPVPLSLIRPNVTKGAEYLLQISAPELIEREPMPELIEQLLTIYAPLSVKHLTFFDGIENLLHYLNTISMPWGVVTNKNSDLTEYLFEYSEILSSSKVLVCGDTLSKAKPDPAPIQYACEQLSLDPTQVIYIGDALTDMQACHAANVQGWIAKYGYIDSSENPEHWPHSQMIDNVTGLITKLQEMIGVR